MKSMMLKLVLHAMVGILLLGCAQILTACTNELDDTPSDDTTPGDDTKEPGEEEEPSQGQKAEEQEVSF